MVTQLRRLSLGLIFRLVVGVLMAVAWADRTFRRRLAFPRDQRDLLERQSWAIERLRASGALGDDAEVTSFVATRFKEGEGFRSQVSRVLVGWRDDNGDHELRLLAKFAPRAQNLRDHAIYIIQENHTKEVGFYQHLAADPAVAAPTCYAAELHRGTGNLCVLLDLVDATEIRESDGCPAELAPMAVEALARQHARYWGTTDGVHADGPAAFLPPLPDAIIDYFGTLFEGPDADLFGDLLRVVWRRDGQAPTTVLHGDARVGNMLFPRGEDGRFLLIDWQATRTGKGAFDLAYFLTLSVEPEVRQAHQVALIDRYHAGLVAGGVADYSRDALDDDYRFATLLVLAFATLPFMSAESSATAANAAGLAELGYAWARRMIAAVDELDHEWLSVHTGLDAAALRAAFGRSNAGARLGMALEPK